MIWSGPVLRRPQRRQNPWGQQDCAPTLGFPVFGSSLVPALFQTTVAGRYGSGSARLSVKEWLEVVVHGVKDPATLAADVPCMSLIHLVYISSAAQAFAEADLVALLERSRRSNEAVGITGLLLYRDGNFMQVLEGEEEAVVATHARTRHRGLITLLQEPIKKRAFGEWSMGFRNLSGPSTRTIPGYNDFMNGDWWGKQTQETPNRALRLLRRFRKDMR